MKGEKWATLGTWMFPKIGGKSPKWMVKIMENPIQIHDLGVPLFRETPKYSLRGAFGMFFFSMDPCH